jgi:exodeoxyribonuclease V alpha subunit
MQQTRAASATLEAVLERITYANQDTGYTVARVAHRPVQRPADGGRSSAGAQPGESLRLRGRWTSHPQHGRQFQVDTYTTMLPAALEMIERSRAGWSRCPAWVPSAAR